MVLVVMVTGCIGGGGGSGIAVNVRRLGEGKMQAIQLR